LVKDKFRPKVDVKKREELQSLIRDLQPKVRDDKLLAEKTKIEGQRNLEKLHQMMGELRAKGKLKKASTPPSPTKLSKQFPLHQLPDRPEIKPHSQQRIIHPQEPFLITGHVQPEPQLCNPNLTASQKTVAIGRP
jgi:hypothetical protein